MSRDDRLKKRTAAHQSKRNDAKDPESGLSGNGGSQVVSHRISASSTRIRRRYKASNSRSENFVRCLRRIVRGCGLQKGRRRRGVGISTVTTATCLLCLFIASSVIFKKGGDTADYAKLRTAFKQELPEFKILFSNTNQANFSQPFFQVDPIKTGLKGKRDYGGLKLGNLEGAQRKISDYDHLSETYFRHPDQSRDDDGNDAYVAFDDDFLRGTTGTMNENPTGKVCRRISSHRASYPNCNSIYELELLNNHVEYLNAGTYRQVFSLNHLVGRENELLAVKDMYQSKYSVAADYEFVRMDAMVAERLTSSPRIYDIYGFCGLSILSEYFQHGDIENMVVPDDTGYLLTEDEQEEYLEDLESNNDLSNEEKLVVSLQMAEAIADLHGHETGVIVHQDIQLSQFLYNSDKSLVKLNDFNRAEFMLFEPKGNEYCKYGEGQGQGNWRSPEEYFDYDLDEQVDVYSFGNNMYSVLTGLYPFYDEESIGIAQNRVKKGLKPYIDPHYKDKSYAEAKLAEIIDRCYAYKPEDRPSIFEIVEFLREALRELRQRDSRILKRQYFKVS